jgi:predicted phage tail protein
MRNYKTAAAAMRRKSITVKAHYQLSDGSTQVMIFGNSYKTWREQLDEYERYGQRTDIHLVELYIATLMLFDCLDISASLAIASLRFLP